ncbi:dimethyladenosine transferase [Nostoc linckia NIES-25]|nr:dimethyladenosine transferase [Nostoc linckia NIES-25]
MIRPRKVFAQHWLKSEKALDAIIKAAECTESDGSANTSGERILEIGPGTGILTRRLLPLVESLLAVEIDRDLCELLAKQLGKRENFLLLQGDFLTLDLPSQLVAFPNFQKQNKVVANIPYNITGPIIEKLLGTIANPNPEPFESIVLLVQKEVAERLYAQPGSKAFGALSVRVQYLAECELICTVPAAAFHPPPKVDSAVVRLRPRKIEIPALDPRRLENLLKLGFAAKRKMLRNNLQSAVERDRLTQLLEQLEINPQARAEDLSVQQWVTLANELGVKSEG